MLLTICENFFLLKSWNMPICEKIPPQILRNVATIALQDILNNIQCNMYQFSKSFFQKVGCQRL